MFPRLDKQDVLNAMQGRFLDFYGQFTALDKSGGEFRGTCPLHGGDGANFTIQPDTGEWFCHSACGEGGDVFAFLKAKEGLRFGDALLQLAEWARVVPTEEVYPKPRVVATYNYVDENGELLYQVLRREPGARGRTKDFQQRRPEGKGGWVYSLGDVRRVLYRLPEVLAAVQSGKPVFVCEGEKAADALRGLGVTATTNSGGADKWEDGLSDSLCGASVVSLPDNDDKGRGHVEHTACSLQGKAKRVRIVSLPDLPPKGDAFEWVAAGGTKAALMSLVKAAPDWMPGQADSPTEAAPPTHSPAEAITLAQDEWPLVPPAMFYGLAGEIVQAVEPHTEADPVAMLVQLLVAFGSAVDRHAHFVAEADRHYSNLDVVLVGISSKGRKGTSWGHIRRMMEAADPVWAAQRIVSGLSSGEGLIWQVRDEITKEVKDKKTGEMHTETVDPGIEDKRLLVIESEFASLLRVLGREGNTLSAIVRNAWDTGDLQSLTKNSPARASGAHISIIGHVTKDELCRYLDGTEAGNGFGNRFLWVCVRRSKELPEGGNLHDEALSPFSLALRLALDDAKKAGRLERDAEARALWYEVYHDLSEGKPGLAGAVTSRGEAQVMRLATLYALVERDTAIRREHLQAALALWGYVEASARYVFGDSLGDPVADDILRALRSAQSGLTRNDLRELFGRHQSSGRVGQALALLHQLGRIRGEKQETDGRPAERWFVL